MDGAGVGARSKEHSAWPVQRSVSPSSSKQESPTVKLRQSCRGASSAWFVHVLQPPTLHRPNQWLITGASSVSLDAQAAVGGRPRGPLVARRLVAVQRQAAHVLRGRVVVALALVVERVPEVGEASARTGLEAEGRG